MPLARIDLVEGKSVEYRRTIADVVYEQMIKRLGVPEDRFQVITEHKIENFLYDPDYLGILRSENCVFIQLSFLDVASEEQKESFYTAVADELHDKLKLRREDVFFNLFTVAHADWSMGTALPPTRKACRWTGWTPTRSSHGRSLRRRSRGRRR